MCNCRSVGECQHFERPSRALLKKLKREIAKWSAERKAAVKVVLTREGYSTPPDKERNANG